MFELLASVLSSSLQIWAHKEKNKYVDRLMELRKAYYLESNKDPSIRSDAVLDNLNFELRILALAFSSTVGKPDFANKS